MYEKLDTLSFFFDEPLREFNIREISRLIKKSPTTVSKELYNFEKHKLLRFRELKMFKFYKADMESENYRDLKLYYNISRLRNSGFIDFLNEFYLKPTIVLFGSFSKGLDNEKSDIDLLIISEKILIPKLDKFCKNLKRKIQIFAHRNISEIKNKNLVNNMANGILIQGDLKWI